MEIISIILVHHSPNKERSDAMRKSVISLVETTKSHACELIVVDNGGSYDDSRWLLAETQNGHINTYTRNARNMHFAFARNQALRMTNGDYICVSDNDILFKEGWLDACLKVLKAYPDKKIWATPLYNVAHYLPRFWSKETLEVDGETYRLNSRAGSNCWVMRREDFEEVGEFLIHRVAGTKFTEESIEKGYLGAVSPKILVKDQMFRKGYNLNDPKPVKIVLTNGEEVFFNDDEFRKNNRGLRYSQQKRFNPQPNIRFKRKS